jgi:hypothetical protein
VLEIDAALGPASAAAVARGAPAEVGVGLGGLTFTAR